MHPKTSGGFLLRQAYLPQDPVLVWPLPPIYTIPCFSGCLQLGNELQKQSRDQTQAIKPADWSVGHVTASASCKQPEKHGNFSDMAAALAGHLSFAPMPCSCMVFIWKSRNKQFF